MENTERERDREEGHVTMEEEIGTAISQGTPRTVESHQNLARGKEGFFSESSEGTGHIPDTLISEHFWLPGP